ILLGQNPGAVQNVDGGMDICILGTAPCVIDEAVEMTQPFFHALHETAEEVCAGQIRFPQQSQPLPR
ncbi:MAG TPA: hypothetical protein VNN08_12235, partial [Thermoanaerobaculia bacterium]|nr:hypothetical protein [Thermoanaerobaculia bacterium]